MDNAVPMRRRQCVSDRRGDREGLLIAIGPFSSRCASVSPSSSSMTRNIEPACSPTSCNVQMFGCVSPAILFASRSKRARRSDDRKRDREGLLSRPCDRDGCPWLCRPRPFLRRHLRPNFVTGRAARRARDMKAISSRSIRLIRHCLGTFASGSSPLSPPPPRFNRGEPDKKPQ